MVKTTAKIMSDESGRPTIIDVKGYKVKLNYNSDGIIYSVDFYGKIPSVPDILSSILGLTSHIASPVKIKTEAENNLIVDMLTQTAYTERRSTLANNGTPTNWAGYIGDDRRGKLFSRGCRGFIKTVEIYCRDAAAAGGTITVYLAPQIGMGSLASATITVPAGGAEAWRSATFNKMWNYDSLFIFVVMTTTDVQFAYDLVKPFDWWASADGGATWSSNIYRPHFRAIYEAETLGDVPVSGTVNNIEIPSVGSELAESGVSVPNATETLLSTRRGAGTLIQAKLYFNSIVAPTSSIYYKLTVYADGALAFSVSNRDLTQSDTATSGRSSIGEFYSITDGEYRLSLRVPIKFKQKLELKAYQNTGVAKTTIAESSISFIN